MQVITVPNVTESKLLCTIRSSRRVAAIRRSEYSNLLEANCFGYTHLCNLITNSVHFSNRCRERNLGASVGIPKKLGKNLEGCTLPKYKHNRGTLTVQLQ